MNNDLANRLKKRQKILNKWAQTEDVSCYRLYTKDIPEYPLIIDRYDDFAVVWVYHRKKDDSTIKEQQFLADSMEQIQMGLSLSADQVILKNQTRQSGQQHYSKSSQWVPIIVKENGLQFEVNLHQYLDTGLFLDHRATRKLVRSISGGKNVLNLYAYTGSFTCYAIAGGAKTTTTVDLSKTYLRWAERNLRLNGFELSDQHKFVQQDCLQFLDQCWQERRQFDLIVCDPPSFSNTKHRKIADFAVDKNYPKLIKSALRLLSPGGILYFSTNHRKLKLKQSLFKNFWIKEITEETLPFDFQQTKIHRCWSFKPL